MCEAVRGEVGPSYPVFIKLGMMDNLESVPDGLTLEDGARIVSRLADIRLDAVEVSGGHTGSSDFEVRLGVGSKASEAYFRALALRDQRWTLCEMYDSYLLQLDPERYGVTFSSDGAFVIQRNIGSNSAFSDLISKRNGCAGD